MAAAKDAGVVNSKGDPLSGSAFSERCKLISPKAFLVGLGFLTGLWQNHPKLFKKIKNRRILVVDGSSLWMSDAIRRDFTAKSRKNRNFWDAPVSSKLENDPCQFRGVFLYDALNQYFLDVELELTDLGERRLAVEVLKRQVKPGDVVIFDRGYPAAWFVHLIRSLGADCIIRMVKDNRRKEVAQALAAESDSTDFSWKIPKKDVAVLNNHGVSAEIDAEVPLRCVRGKSEKENHMLFATTLSAEEFSDNEIRDLYRRRWKVETALGRLKGHRKIEAWSGRSLHRLELDLRAAILGDAINSILAAEAQIVVDQEEVKREAQRNNPPAKRAPGRPRVPGGQKYYYKDKHLNRKQFQSIVDPIVLPLMLGRCGEAVAAALALATRMAIRRASWSYHGAFPERRKTPVGLGCINHRQA